MLRVPGTASSAAFQAVDLPAIESRFAMSEAVNHHQATSMAPTAARSTWLRASQARPARRAAPAAMRSAAPAGGGERCVWAGFMLATVRLPVGEEFAARRAVSSIRSAVASPLLRPDDADGHAGGHQ